MSEFRRPSPVESGEPTEPTLAREESSEAKLTRRGFLKGALGLGLAAAISPLPEFNSHSASADALDSNEEDVELPGVYPLLERFQEYTPEAMVEAVRNNIDTFFNVPPERISSLGSKVKTDISFPGYGTVDTPIIDPEPQNPDSHKTYFIAEDGNPSKFFPNVGLSYRTIQQGENGDQHTLYMQGIYLGRTELGFSSANAGEVVVDVGYFGQYFGDGDDMKRLIMPVFLGWKSPDEQISNNSNAIVRPVDSGKYTGPFSISGDFDTAVNVVKSFDQNVGNSVAELHIGTYDPPDASWGDMAESFGWPREFYELDYMLKESETTGKVADAIENITSAKALDLGYSLNSVINSSAISTPIPDEYPEIADIDIKEEAQKIISYKKLLNMTEITLKDSVRLPRFYEGIISPTSETISQ